MSPSIWTQCEALFSERPLAGLPWRAAEAQHVNSTRKLVDSDDEQEVLERWIDSAKPPWPTDRRFRGLHYLLATPFRYPPLRYGSRFGTRHERGIYYCSERQSTVFAEKAYYALVFLEGTHAELGPLTRPLIVFQARVSTRRGADLTQAPFERFTDQISSPLNYAASQPLGTALRGADIHAFRFRSARDPAGGANLGLFEPVFTAKKRAPTNAEAWICTATRAHVEFKPGPAVTRSRTRFPRATFEVAGALPVPGGLAPPT